MTYELSGKVALVTGAGRGLGRAIALELARRGALLAANDISPMGVDATVEQAVRAGGQAKAYVFDVAKRMPVEAMLDEILGDFGRLDILVNNAAVQPKASLLDMDEWDWHRVIDVNLGGPFFTMQHAGRAMREQGGGVILNLADTALALPGLDGRTAYLASKGGLLALSRQAAYELGGYGIRVNAMCTGVFLADSAPTGWLSASDLAAPTEPAELAAFLCSPAAARLTGQIVYTI